MTGSVRLAAGIGAVVLVMTALGMASPTSAETGRPTDRTEVSAEINR